MALPTSADGESPALRVAISSTLEEIEPYRAAAAEVAREQGFEPLLTEIPPTEQPSAADEASVQEIAGQVAEADLLLAIVGWRRGEMPDPERGGDGRRSWTAWEVRAALRRAQPLVVLMAGDGWPKSRREKDPEARAWLLDFRGDLHSLAAFFDPEPPGARAAALAGFRELVRRELARHAGGATPVETSSETTSEHPERLRLRHWPPPEWPERPYPLLLPYSHPALLSGRERELDEVTRLLRLPVPILGLHAPSGAGKSSFLAAGLVPRLDTAGLAVSFDRHPSEPGLAGRLIGDLLDADQPTAFEIEDGDRRGFIDHLCAARALAGAPPLLVLDQFEDLLRHPSGDSAELRRARAVTGALLAASAQRQPSCDGPLCRWLLVYRQEFHGEVFRWLGDALREARGLGLAGAGTLPHDLSGPDRFHACALAPLGVPRAGSADLAAAAARVFQVVIENPLAVRDEDGAARYPWVFAAGGAERLARAFGEARAAQPRAPLVPELQVVLAHLLERAVPSPDDGRRLVEVPEEPGELIAQALEQHLRRTLEGAFPGHGEAARLGRTRAVLALRELADATGQRGEGLAAEELARAIGREGREVLEQLATPRSRLVVAERRAGEWIYVLSHDRLAEVLVRLVDEEGGQAGLGVDPELLGLRRFVALKTELFAAGETAQATEIPAKSFHCIEQHAPALLWGEERRRWWQACRTRFRAERRRKMLHRAVAALVVLAVVAGVWRWTDRRTRRAALFDELARGGPEAAFAAADRLLVEWQAEPEQLRAALRQRQQPLDVLERGIGGVAVEDGREDAVLRLAELALPLIVEDAPENPERIASLVWALDFFAPKGERTRQLRDLALEPLRRRRPPPTQPAPGDPAWADIPAGTFRIGHGPGEGRDDDDEPDEQPHQVTLSAFRMGAHEVTYAEFRRLYPEHAEGQDDRLPAAKTTWSEAYTYAAWLGGRLPTETEWEYAARAGCGFAYCRRDGTEASLDEVAWWLDNTTDPKIGEPVPRPVGQLEPNPRGLFDLYGNINEFCADWSGAYRKEELVDPPGPTNSDTGYRIARGGSVFSRAEWLAAHARNPRMTSRRYVSTGLRVVLYGPASRE